jgi:hypothetical protein
MLAHSELDLQHNAAGEDQVPAACLKFHFLQRDSMP